MDAQWADDVHHALHVRLTGERQGYYEDFAAPGAFTKAYGRVFLHDGILSTFRGRTWGAPVPPGTDPRRFVVFGFDHDQVGNRATGDRPSASLDDDALAASAALVLLSPYTPMLFMGEEWGTRRPFQFFTDHTDPHLAATVSRGRREEFEGFGWGAGEIPGPQDPGTFARSHLDWDELTQKDHARVLAWYRSLVALRRRLGWGQRRQWPWVEDALDVITVTYEDVVVVANLSGDTRPAPAARQVLLSWLPVAQGAPGTLAPGQTLVATR